MSENEECLHQKLRFTSNDLHRIVKGIYNNIKEKSHNWLGYSFRAPENINSREDCMCKTYPDTHEASKKDSIFDISKVVINENLIDKNVKSTIIRLFNKDGFNEDGLNSSS